MSGGKSQLLRLSLSLVLLAGATVAQSEWVEWVTDARLSATHQDNLGRSAFDKREFEDTTVTVSASLGRYLQVSDRARKNLDLLDIRGGLYPLNRLARLMGNCPKTPKATTIGTP